MCEQDCQEWSVVDVRHASSGWWALYRRDGEPELLMAVAGWLILQDDRESRATARSPFADGDFEVVLESQLPRRVVAGVVDGHQVVRACSLPGLESVKPVAVSGGGR